MGARRIIVGWALIAHLGCSSDPLSITPFGVPFDPDSRPVLVNVELGDNAVITASVDTMAPLTIIDQSEIGAQPPEITREIMTVSLLSRPTSGDPVPRARFSGVETLISHPCQQDTSPVSDDCEVGQQGQSSAIQAILGANLLSRNAVRFDFANHRLDFFPDIAGSANQRAELCDAVFDGPFHGGGTVVVSGAEISVSGYRIAIGACFFNDLCDGVSGPHCDDVCGVPRPQGMEQGVDALFVLSTGIGTTIVNRTTYDRYVSMYQLTGRTPAPPAYNDLPTDRLYLSSGPIDVRIASMNHLALVAENSDQRGPCDERYANDYLTRRRECADSSDPDCPCSSTDQTFCRASAVSELSLPQTSESVHEGIEVAVVPDGDPTLQALRNELRPDLPEVSGILGTNALTAMIVDADYPNGRVLMRCSDDDVCTVRPRVFSRSLLSTTLACMPERFRTCIPQPPTVR